MAGQPKFFDRTWVDLPPEIAISGPSPNSTPPAPAPTESMRLVPFLAVFVVFPVGMFGSALLISNLTGIEMFGWVGLVVVMWSLIFVLAKWNE